jgi:hypothetical protein
MKLFLGGQFSLYIPGHPHRASHMIYPTMPFDFAK